MILRVCVNTTVLLFDVGVTHSLLELYFFFAGKFSIHVIFLVGGHYIDSCIHK